MLIDVVLGLCLTIIVICILLIKEKIDPVAMLLLLIFITLGVGVARWFGGRGILLYIGLVIVFTILNVVTITE